MPVILCFECNKVFTKQKNLNRHVRNIHERIPEVISYDSSVYINKCLEGCGSFKNIKDLRAHLESAHEFNSNEETHNFKCKNDFEIWFKNTCRQRDIRYVHKTSKPTNNATLMYYYCNRSGTSGNKPCRVENRKRNLKCQGYIQLPIACTSQVIVRCQENGQYFVTHYKTHYGHNDKDIEHIIVAKADGIEVANKPISSVPPSRILEANIKTFNQKCVSRTNLLTKQDSNIKRSYHIDIQGGVRHKNDVISVDLWVEEYKQTENNSLLMYKKRGEQHSQLATDDFCLVFMNKSQEYLLQKFGHNIICIDSTHGLNSYDFELTTVMIVDDFGEGIPVACMFSNRKDTIIFETFFSEIKSETGIISPLTFMSDLPDVFYDAWSSVMGAVQYRLLCSCHVDRAWRSNLNKIVGTEKRTMVYKTVKVLQTELDEGEFLRYLQKFMEFLLSDIDTKPFYEYFRTNYSGNCTQWAYCYRRNCGINTNMCLESMHNMIKYFYLNARKIKRLDKGIYVVSSFVRDKMVERIVKKIKGKSTYCKSIILKRHIASKQCSFKVDFEDNCWIISSGKNHYVVTNNFKETCCQLYCAECNICVHSYRCTCTDFFIKSTICKHIHFVVSKFVEKKSEVIRLQQESANFEIEIHLNTLSDGNIKTREESRRSKLQEACDRILQLSGSIDVMDDNIYSFGLQSLNRLYDVMKNSATHSATSPVMKEESSEPPNKKIKKQARYSTKRKVKFDENATFSKPNVTEIVNIKNSLTGQCFVSNNAELDHSYI